MSSRVIAPVLAVLLLAAALWIGSLPLNRGAPFRLDPPQLALAPGERTQLRIVAERPDVVALSFAVRFDPRIVAIEEAGPTARTISSGGKVLVLPVSRGRGHLDVLGLAMTGGHAFPAGRAVYQLVLRGLTPGTAEVSLQRLVEVDRAGHERALAPAAAQVTVRNPQ